MNTIGNTVSKEKKILLTFDVEDWFQVENFKEYIPTASWETKELRVEQNTLQLLDILDSAATEVKATFFILGWIAERCPDLVREIHSRGHEVASHGFNHHLCYNQHYDELRDDLHKSKDLLESITGQEVVGYRAPSFSINDNVLQVVQEVGYLYDSSYNSYSGHGRYGSLRILDDKMPNKTIYKLSSSFYEIPVSNVQLGKKVIPWGGGGYFRLLPFLLYQAGVRYTLNKCACFVFYMHPWEIDTLQPRVRDAKASFRFRHYINIWQTKRKLEKFIKFNENRTFLTARSFTFV